MSTATAKLEDVVRIHQSMVAYRNDTYINLIQQINTKASAAIKDDMGGQFIQNCSRDLAGEVVRNFFDTSDYNITVDQLAMRILKFSYEDEYDPLHENGGVGEVRKSVYSYNELQSSELDRISADLDASQEKLFKKVDGKYEDSSLMQKGKEQYAASKTKEDGTITDEYTDQEGGRKKTLGDTPSNRQEVDHSQSANQATYNKKYLSEKGIEELKVMMNSADNFAMMEKSANASKGDVQVFEKNGKVLTPDAVRAEKKEIATRIKKETGQEPSKKEVNEAFEKTVKNITSRATPEQIADAVCDRWENAGNKQALIDKGYLNEDGTVPKSVRKRLVQNVRHSQNAESVVILKNTKYGEVAKDAAKHTKAAVGKIIAGQIIYYAAPPLVYEVRMILNNRQTKLDSALSQLGNAAQRIGEYVFSKIKDIFSNVVVGSLKKFIKSFMDILIGAVKATVKKLLKMAKNLVLTTVDAVRIIADKNASPAEKADSVFSVFGATITSCVIEVLFELAADALHIPEPFDDIIFGPLQILTTVVCTNLTMLILQKADLFDVRFGFKINAIKKIFEEDYNKFSKDMQVIENYTQSRIEDIIQSAQAETRNIYSQLQDLDPKRESVRTHLNKINSLFSIQIDYDGEWEKFIGIHPKQAVPHGDNVDPFRTDYRGDREGGLAAIALIYYFRHYDPYIVESVNPHRIQLATNTEKEVRAISSSSIITFGETSKYLDKISQNTLFDLSVMIDQIMKAGRGCTETKKSAKIRFDKYCEDRYS